MYHIRLQFAWRTAALREYVKGKRRLESRTILTLPRKCEETEVLTVNWIICVHSDYVAFPFCRVILSQLFALVLISVALYVLK